jgi:AraC-like DNA-binding protein
MLYLAGVIITFFLAFILLSKIDKTEADTILFFWLIGIGIHLFLYYLFFSGKYTNYPYLLGIHLPLPLIHGPFLYLYTASITNQLKNWKIGMLHFLPVLLYYISILDFFQFSNDKKIQVFKNLGKGYENIQQVSFILIIFSGITYVVWSFILLRNHKKNISNQFSYSEKINLVWLRNLIYGIGLIWLFVIFGNDKLLFSTAVLFVFFIGYFGINQVGIFTKKMPFIEDSISYQNKKNEIYDSERIEDIKPLKYVKSGLNSEAAFELYELLKIRMSEEKFYINPELTLTELAQKLEIHPNNLSQVINTFEEKNFYDYINFKRVEHFTALISLPENRKFTILSLAFECGFNSKSSFNKYFKKVTHLTPSEYLNSLSEKQVS